jgi:hypothetical protein
MDFYDIHVLYVMRVNTTILLASHIPSWTRSAMASGIGVPGRACSQNWAAGVLAAVNHGSAGGHHHQKECEWMHASVSVLLCAEC